MDKRLMGLLGAASTLALGGAAKCFDRGSLYADLLAPIPNASAQLKADDAARMEVAEVVVVKKHRRHHHHHHDHHHHHHHG